MPMRVQTTSTGSRGVLGAFLVAVASLGGCGGGGSGSEAPTEGSGPRVDGDESSSDAGLRFVVAEDGTLENVLSDPTRPGETTSTPFSVLSYPARGTLELRPDGRTFGYTPEADFSGEDGFEYGDGERVLSAAIDVTPVPDAPVLELDDRPLLAVRDERFERTLAASDADGDVVRFEARGLPVWLSLDAESGLLSGTPTAADAGLTEGIAFAAVDPSGRRDERDGLALEVVEAGELPVPGDPDETLALDPSRFPSTLAGRERREVEAFDDDADLEGVTLAVEGDPALDARVDGRRVILEASDVETVTEAVVVLRASDRLGRTRRVVVPITLLPTSPSGEGMTILGSRSGPGVHLVVLGDGYLVDQQERLRADAQDLIDVMRTDPGIASHLGAFNVHVVRSVSRDEGALPEGLPSRLHSTVFGSRYGCEGVAQLICADPVEPFVRAGEEYDVDLVVLMVNDARFGGSGSGGGVAIASRGEPAVALHELGHTLAGLADEYVDGAFVEGLAPTFTEGLYPNVTAITDPAAVPWARWIDDAPFSGLPRFEGEAGVGLFEGALYRERGVFRPTSTSRMREFEQPFGPVNSERWVLGVYRVGSTVRGFEPRVFDVELAAGEVRRFSVTPFFPTDVQRIEWSLNGERVRRADDARVLEIAPPVGSHRLRLSVRDVSGAIRLEPPHNGVFEWTWNIEVR